MRSVPLASRFCRALSVALCALCLADTLQATTVIPASLEEIVEGSQLIVHGRVIDVQARTTADRRSIFSLVTVAVDEAVKGSPGRAVTFRVPGGQIGRYRRVIVGAPEFATGDEVVVFLRGGGAAVPTLFGLGQGVYKVERHEPTRAASAGRFIGQVRLLARGAR